MKRSYTTPQTPTRGQTIGRTVSGCGAYGIAEHMAEREKSELGCARLLHLLRQVHGEPRACGRWPWGCAMYDIFSIVGAVSLAVSGGAVLVNLPQVERLVPGDVAQRDEHEASTTL
jgi:hypothetical protein